MGAGTVLYMLKHYCRGLSSSPFRAAPEWRSYSFPVKDKGKKNKKQQQKWKTNNTIHHQRTVYCIVHWEGNVLFSLVRCTSQNLMHSSFNIYMLEKIQHARMSLCLLTMILQFAAFSTSQNSKCFKTSLLQKCCQFYSSLQYCSI